MNLKKNIELAKSKIEEADSILITSGAGMGVDSGLPDFRGTSGFWKAYPIVAKMGISFSEMANPKWFDNKPYLAWAFYGHRLNLYRETIPHNGFQKLLELGENKSGGYFVFTSNVDGQFQKAGFKKENIQECHGSIHHFQCTGPCSNDIWNAEKEKIKVDLEKFEAVDPLPKCMHCGNLARPNILMFGDWSWIPDRTNEQATLLEQWLIKNNQLGNKLLVIEFGAGTSVATVRYKSESIVNRYNGKLIRINPRDYDVSAGQISLPFGAEKGIEKLLS